MIASTAETARRVDVIVGMMQRDEWRSERCVDLGAEWKVAPGTVESLATEASRRVVFIARLAANPDELKADVTSVLVRSLHAAHDERARGDVARLGDIVTKITGARAPEKFDLTLRQYEDLEPSQLHARLLEQRAKLDEAIAKLEDEHPVLIADPGPDVVVESLAFATDRVSALTLHEAELRHLTKGPGVRTPENPGACCFAADGAERCAEQPDHDGIHRSVSGQEWW